MEFSNQEKLIITLLTDIHAALKIQDSVDPLFVQRMVNRGDGWALQWAYPVMFRSVDETPAHVKFVAEVLEMWWMLERAYGVLSDDQRQELEALVPVFGARVHFDGFDGNNEPEYCAAARIMVEDLDRWAEFKGRTFNSHYPAVESNKRMLAIFNAQKDSGAPLGVKELAEVLNERAHPENR